MNKLILIPLTVLAFGCSEPPNAQTPTHSQTTSKVSDKSVNATAASDDNKQVKIGEIRWYVDYDQALEVAQRDKKPIWLHFGENPG